MINKSPHLDLERGRKSWTWKAITTLLIVTLMKSSVWNHQMKSSTKYKLFILKFSSFSVQIRTFVLLLYYLMTGRIMGKIMDSLYKTTEHQILLWTLKNRQGTKTGRTTYLTLIHFQFSFNFQWLYCFSVWLRHIP